MNNGTVVGSKQTIIRTTNGGVTFVEDDNAIPSQPKNFHLCQNYPNPFNLSTRIQYSVNSTQNVTLKVYDLLGREVATLVNEEKPAGEYEVEFNTNRRSGEVRNLTSGIYCYQLKTGDYIATKKMVLLK